MGTVKVFRSSDYGAPVLYGNAGYMIPVLDASLVNGYGEQSVTSITHAAGVVTVTCAAAHNLSNYSRQTIAGVTNDTVYNGEYIITVTGGDTFTYEKAGITEATGTGTITTKSAAAGWTKPYNGTNLAAYRQGSGRQHYLRIDDTTTLTCRVVGYEAMTAISTGTGPFPTAAQFAGGLYFQKSSTADIINPRDWILIADDTTFYLHVNWDSGTTYVNSPLVAFGEFNSDKDADGFNTFISANVSGAVAGFRFGYLPATVQIADTGRYIARSYSQAGTSMPGAFVSDSTKSNGASGMGSTPGLPYPHPVNGGLCMAPVWLVETAPVLAQSVLRGTLKGVWNPLHSRPLFHTDIFQGNGALAGKTFMAFGIQTTNMCMIDISPTW